ncbi:MAG TPA: HIT family protein [Anaerohalosphaeraceae bacterium]|nr:HIT family protein [Anaerohalosphaeraceae bacterium]HOM77050.1 HIT family protein [Anaerohalosphaeraceae bacterium]HPO69772.1 HIT family protein [Anaerohalosphaeraceae bacterium]HRV20881.1 HIT family protein [Anaerohalosphaeraceae bacterium]
MEGQDCIFCKIIAGQIPCTKVFENEAVLAFLDIGPVSDGHLLVVPKVHTSRLENTPGQTLAEAVKVLPMLAQAVQRAVDAEGCNVLCNNGRCAGQVVEHLHLHLVPRKPGDGIFNSWPSFRYPPGKAEQIAQKIIQNLKPSF